MSFSFVFVFIKILKGLYMKRKIQWGTVVFLIIYLLILAYVCFLSESFGRAEVQNAYHINLMPFHEVIRFYTYRKKLGIGAFAVNMFGNVGAFIPFGFILPILRWNKYKGLNVIALMTFCLSLIIECIQIISRVGAFDVDDLILNTLGGIMGYMIFCLVNRIRRCLFGKIQ